MSNSGLNVTDAVYSFELLKGNNKEWVKRASMPMATTHTAQVAVGTRLYMCGGYLGRHPGPSVPNCFMYDSEVDRWITLPSLPASRAGGGLVYIRQANALFFSSGAMRSAGVHRSIDKGNSYILRLDNLAGGWSERAMMPNPRNHMSATEVDGRYFFIGGQHSNNEATGNQADMHEYDFDRDLWLRKAKLSRGVGHVSASTPRYWHGFFMIGGVENGRQRVSRVMYYSVQSDAWYTIGNYPRTVQTPVCGVIWNNLVCAGGEGDPGIADQAFVRRVGF